MLGGFIDRDEATSSETVFTESIAWSKSWHRRGYVYGKPADLKNVYFRIPWAWSRVYRAGECTVALTESVYKELQASALTKDQKIFSCANRERRATETLSHWRGIARRLEWIMFETSYKRR
jgi:hypothetical protein